ncbi:GumC family protein [Oceanicella actignis]|uniref:Polysaccharide chain length determinant protein, PEP-CTERM locus subfamily n=1 Tax=Oceanicella actignis TaxID=1189325 RepID=A0A1M7SWJ6_9RHOB|nr:Wzz/FepE/Etk N-terminal domain-containing protein [Oceanicella actignis]SES73782.1 polysaccharide chain length determinant protein, PEP-CTERM locus subfamily [Oceanicella actignis]SHN62776.1 polysaccharide chain length determinant protein, PEP-CTERM locus subfamily [Oceanicella actignis]
MNSEFDFGLITAIIKRRLGLVLSFAIATFLIFAAVAYLLPPRYKASATILVESQQIPTSLVQSTVASNAAERIRVIEQRLLTRATLLDIAAKHRVFADRPDMSPSQIFEAMRDATAFELMQFGDPRSRRSSNAIAFTVTFEADKPQIAAAVANELVTLILEQNVKLRTGRAAQTYEFFEQEVARLSDELQKIENEIVAFKKANRDSLPESLDYRRDRLALTQQRISLLERERANLLDEKRILAAGLEDPELLAQQLDRPLTDNEKELRALERERARQRAILAESHPRIRALDARIAALRKIVAEELGAADGAAEDAGASGRNAIIRKVEQDIAVIDKRIANIEEEIAQLDREQHELERTISQTPSVEMALAGLNRRYAGLQAQYRDVQAKLASAATGEQLELKQQAERFEVIEQPSVPERPASPNRPLILLAGLGAGLGGGVALAFLIEFLNRRVRRPSEIVAALNIEPLAVIPLVRTAAEIRAQRRRRALVALGVIAATAVGLAALHFLYLPLDLLAERAIEKARLDSLVGLVRARLQL